MDTATHPLLESPDGESRASIARVGDAFPLDPTASIWEASTEARTQVRPWGLRYAVTPQARAEVVESAERFVYDPVKQMSVDRLTGQPCGKRGSGTKETTGNTDNQGPSGEETSTD
ncbi:putative ATP-grasp-modified RiPP [Nocardiopsis exhalans]|uniref:ATP-grasp-modified RiPP n=1 Tax=Nocardiopsis exhalans TaxID=163604 RepID=A0ABY5D2V1_9ACTN|nr:putative ATP-grasp-modified RiPP [Nocardiopsis exhalans]USY17853.1 putative ATP-grasp-modified RiPP [Nocardiopsis exhalans]